MRIAWVGGRGVPALYGGFETAVSEIGARLDHASVESGCSFVANMANWRGIPQASSRTGFDTS